MKITREGNQLILQLDNDEPSMGKLKFRIVLIRIPGMDDFNRF